MPTICDRLDGNVRGRTTFWSTKVQMNKYRIDQIGPSDYQVTEIRPDGSERVVGGFLTRERAEYWIVQRTVQK
jgi:hypothetical protein